MERFIILITSFLMVACCNKNDDYLETFDRFAEAVITADLNTVRKASTEATYSMVEQFFTNKRLQDQQHLICRMMAIASEKNNMQSKIAIITHSMSHDGNTAWVWFRIGHSTEEFMVSLINNKGYWRVDIPVVDVASN